MFVLCFLNGLRDQYSQIKMQILQTDIFPSINQVFSKILRQEKPVTGSVMYQDESKVSSMHQLLVTVALAKVKGQMQGKFVHTIGN